jgi:hypothetical protein
VDGSQDVAARIRRIAAGGGRDRAVELGDLRRSDP